MDKLDFAGVEVSKKELVVALQREGQRKALKTFANTPPGHQGLIRHLSHPGRSARVCLESTGMYGLDVALALQRAGLEVMVANPRAVRNFAKALMERSKNDQIDAGVLLEFAARMPFQAWVAPRPAALRLHALARRLEALTEMQTAEKGRLEAAAATDTMLPALRRDLERSLRSLRRALARLSGEALKIIEQDPGLKLRFDLLISVHGSIAATSAIQILAELAVLSEDLDVRQYVAYAGLGSAPWSAVAQLPPWPSGPRSAPKATAALPQSTGGCARKCTNSRAGLQPRRQARLNIFNNLPLGRRYGRAEAPTFRGPE